MPLVACWQGLLSCCGFNICPRASDRERHARKPKEDTFTQSSCTCILCLQNRPNGPLACVTSPEDDRLDHATRRSASLNVRAASCCGPPVSPRLRTRSRSAPSSGGSGPLFDHQLWRGGGRARLGGAMWLGDVNNSSLSSSSRSALRSRSSTSTNRSSAGAPLLTFREGYGAAFARKSMLKEIQDARTTRLAEQEAPLLNELDALSSRLEHLQRVAPFESRGALSNGRRGCRGSRGTGVKHNVQRNPRQHVFAFGASDRIAAMRRVNDHLHETDSFNCIDDNFRQCESRTPIQSSAIKWGGGAFNCSGAHTHRHVWNNPVAAQRRSTDISEEILNDSFGTRCSSEAAVDNSFRCRVNGALVDIEPEFATNFKRVL